MLELLMKKGLIWLTRIIRRVSLFFSRFFPFKMRHVQLKNLREFITIWIVIEMIIGSMTKNMPTTKLIVAALGILLFEVSRVVWRIEGKYTSLLYVGYSPEEAHKRLESLSLQSFFTPTAEERNNAIQRCECVYR